MTLITSDITLRDRKRVLRGSFGNFNIWFNMEGDNFTISLVNKKQKFIRTSVASNHI